MMTAASLLSIQPELNFTKDSSSAALPFAEHHWTGHPVCRYFSQPRLYLVIIIALKIAIVNTFLKNFLIFSAVIGIYEIFQIRKKRESYVSLTLNPNAKHLSK